MEIETVEQLKQRIKEQMQEDLKQLIALKNYAHAGMLRDFAKNYLDITL